MKFVANSRKKNILKDFLIDCHFKYIVYMDTIFSRFFYFLKIESQVEKHRKIKLISFGGVKMGRGSPLFHNKRFSLKIIYQKRVLKDLAPSKNIMKNNKMCVPGENALLVIFSKLYT